MNRTTKAELQAICDLINKRAGTPLEPYRQEGDKWIPNAGAYYIAGAYGGHKLEQMSHKEGCTGTDRDPINTGYTSKSNLASHMRAFLAGMET